MLKIKTFLFFYTFLYIFFADTYLFVPWIKPVTILNYSLVIISILYSKKSNKTIQTIQILLFILIFYIFIINIIQNNLTMAFSMLTTTLPIPFIFSLFYRVPYNNQIIFFYVKFYLIYNAIFAFIQTAGISITAGSLLSKIPGIGVTRGFVEDLQYQGLRVSGATASSIELACILGFSFLLLFYTKVDEKILSPKEKKFYIALIIVLIFLTQTRSLIFSLPIVIFLTSFFLNKKTIKTYTTIGLAVSLSIGIFYLLLPILIEIFPRLFLSANEDGSIVHRLQANVFGIIGVYYTSFWTGIPLDEILQAIRIGHNHIGTFIGTYFIQENTDHNQIAYFFKYYGFIGLSIFIYIFYKLILWSKSNYDPSIKKTLFASIIFYLMYTLSHNNHILMDYYFWIFMSLTSIYTINNKGKL